jgi:hypothetical protein
VLERRFCFIKTFLSRNSKILDRISISVLHRKYITDCGDWATPRHYSERVLEQASTERNNRSNPSYPSAKFLRPSQPGTFWVVHLVVEVCLSKRENRHQWSPMRQEQQCMVHTHVHELPESTIYLCYHYIPRMGIDILDASILN